MTLQYVVCGTRRTPSSKFHEVDSLYLEALTRIQTLSDVSCDVEIGAFHIVEILQVLALVKDVFE